jgi:tetratricopeptide (TPR) repeat protein
MRLRTLTLIGILACFAGATSSLHAQTGYRQHLADNTYDKGDLSTAIELYRNLLDKNPNDPVLNYNIGNALYRMQQYEQALPFYQRALANTDDERLRSDIQYNMANCLYKSQKLQESIDGYKRVLRKNPSDEDARFNLEYALKQLQKEPPPPQKGDDEKKSPKQEDKNEQKQDRQEQKNKNEQNKPDPNQSSEEKRSMAQNQGLTKKEAERLLDALKNLEKDYQKKKVKEKALKESNTDKDW